MDRDDLTSFAQAGPWIASSRPQEAYCYGKQRSRIHFTTRSDVSPTLVERHNSEAGDREAECARIRHDYDAAKDTQLTAWKQMVEQLIESHSRAFVKAAKEETNACRLDDAGARETDRAEGYKDLEQSKRRRCPILEKGQR